MMKYRRLLTLMILIIFSGSNLYGGGLASLAEAPSIPSTSKESGNPLEKSGHALEGPLDAQEHDGDNHE